MTLLGMSIKGKVLFWVLLNLGIFFVLEGGTRLAYFLATQNTYYLTYGLKYDRAWGPKFRDFLEPHEGYFKFKPNRTHILADETTRINNHGFRGKDFQVAKEPGTFRVVTLGESSTFGFHSSDPFTYPALLESRLGGHETCERHFEVINAGMPWISSEQIATLLEREVLAYRPDAITLYAGHNDSVATGSGTFSEIKRARLGWNPGEWWKRRSFLVREMTYIARDKLLLLNELGEFTKQIINYRMSPERALAVSNDIQRVERAIVDAEVGSTASDYEKSVRRIIEAARSAGIGIHVITQPMTLLYTYEDIRKRFGPKVISDDDLVARPFQASLERIKSKLRRDGAIYDFEMSLLKTEANMDILRKLAQEYSVDLVDFFPAVDAEPHLLVSYVHLSEEGNKRLAGLLYESFERQRIGCN
jgi:lysophospholipase L1-like esterase